jgi:multidrug efflux system membrane fusion protein
MIMANWIGCAARGVVIGILGSATLAGGLGCNRGAAKGATAPPPPPPMVSETAAIARDVPLYLDEIGKATATESVTVMPQVAGRVDALHFKDGADLKQGQVLFTLDARPFVALQHQAEAQLTKDQAAAQNAEAFLKRQQDVFKQGVVTASDYDTAVFNAKAAAAAVEADKSAIESAKLNVDYCTIKSPIDGRASMRLVDPGNVVKINETPMLVIQKIDPIYADFTINESELLNVRQQMANGTLKTLVRLPEDKDYHQGSLTFLDNSVQDGSGTIKLRATLDNANKHFWPGQFVNVRLVLSILKDAVLVPTSVPQQSQQGTFALVVKDQAGPDGKPITIAEMRPVVLGQRQGDMIVVSKGVAAGEKVITDGQMLVRPGGPVTVLPPAPAPVSTPPTTIPPNEKIGGAK